DGALCQATALLGERGIFRWLRWGCRLNRQKTQAAPLLQPAFRQLPRHRPADYLAAPCFRRISATSRCTRRLAHARGVDHGAAAGTLVGAPRASRNSTMSGMLVRAAHPSGVERYSSSTGEIDAPASSRMVARAIASLAASPRPQAQSWCKN